MNNIRKDRIEIRDRIAGGNEVLPRLETLLRLLTPESENFPFYTRSRVKNSDSFMKKVVKKRREKCPSYGPSSVTDVCGIRIVTLYDDELIKSIDIALSLLDSGRLITNPLFSGRNKFDPIIECIFYPRENSEEDIYTQCREYMVRAYEESLGRSDERKDVNELFRLEPAENTKYSSLHLVFKAYSQRIRDFIPVELQIRTASEDVWGEIDHELAYKTRHDHLWSEAVEKDYANLNIASQIFKDSVSILPGQIQQLRQHSDSLRGSLEKLRSPDNTFIFSVPLTIIEGALDNGLPQSVREQLSVYESCWKFKSKRKLNVANLPYEKALNSLAEAEKLLVKTQLSDKATVLVNLCFRFEVLRIKIIRVMHADWSDVPGEELYGSMLDLESDLGWIFKPKAALKYWLAQAASISTSKHARSQYLPLLLEASEELRFDETLPEWSVYRSAIPTEIATQYAGLAADMVKDVETKSPLIRQGLEMMLMALDYAKDGLDSFNESINHDNGNFRGDLVLGHRQHNWALEATAFIRISTSCQIMAKLLSDEDSMRAHFFQEMERLIEVALPLAQEVVNRGVQKKPGSKKRKTA